MPLISAILKTDIKTRISTDPAFAKDLYDITFKAMDKFQTAQKIAVQGAFLAPGMIQSGSFTAAKKIAALAYAKEMVKLQPAIADTVSKAVSASVNTFVKSATIITPPGQLVVTVTPTGPGSGSTTSPSSPAQII